MWIGSRVRQHQPGPIHQPPGPGAVMWSQRIGEHQPVFTLLDRRKKDAAERADDAEAVASIRPATNAGSRNTETPGPEARSGNLPARVGVKDASEQLSDDWEAR